MRVSIRCKAVCVFVAVSVSYESLCYDLQFLQWDLSGFALGLLLARDIYTLSLTLTV